MVHPSVPTVRDATQEDASQLVRFNVAMARETEGKVLDGEKIDRGVRSVLSDPDKGHYLVAEIDGQVVGALMITREYSDWRDGWFWWIQSVYVEQSHRRHGVFTSLYQHVQHLAAEAGNVCGLRLYVDGNNHVAQGVYRSLGMHSAPYVMMEVDHVLRVERPAGCA